MLNNARLSVASVGWSVGVLDAGLVGVLRNMGPYAWRVVPCKFHGRSYNSFEWGIILTVKRAVRAKSTLMRHNV